LARPGGDNSRPMRAHVRAFVFAALPGDSPGVLTGHAARRPPSASARRLRSPDREGRRFFAGSSTVFGTHHKETIRMTTGNATTHGTGKSTDLRRWMMAAAALISAIGGACGAGAGDTSGTGGGTGAMNGGGGQNGGAGSCTEQPLFPFRGLGASNTDLYRQIRLDEPTGDLYFSDYKELFVLRAGSGAPQKIADQGDAFWLAGDSILFPGPIYKDTTLTVLSGMSRNGGALSDLVTTPRSTSFNDVFDVREVLAVGDEVLWIAREMHTNNPAALPPTWDRKSYYVRKTSWRSPGTPQVLYTGTRDLFGLIVGGGKLYVSEETGAVDSNEYVGKIIDLAGGGAQPGTTNDRYGGLVVDADDASVIVSREGDPTIAGQWGVFRLAPDGSGEAQIESFPALFRGVFFLAHRSGTWVFTEKPTLDGPATVYAYTVAGGKRRLGCVSDAMPTSNFAIELSASAVYLSVLRNSSAAAILRYPL
jgi:hypothetical protein